jgi:hypothetical protein
VTEPNKVGRPATGQTPVRTVRIGPVWDDALALMKERGDKMPHIIEAALKRYIARHRHD